MKKKVILGISVLTAGLLLSHTFAADTADDLFGDLGLDNNTNTTATTDTGNTNTTTDNLFGDNTTDTKQTKQTKQTEQTSLQTQTEVELEKLGYYTSGDEINFVVNYLPKQSNFIVEFTGNRSNDITIDNVEVTDLSGKQLDLGGLLQKLNLLVVGQDIRKISLAELNKKSVTIKKTDKVYLQGELNDVDKQVLSTILGGRKEFRIIFKGNKVSELIPFKEGVLKNNATLKIKYLYLYKEESQKNEVVKDKIANEVIKKKDTGPKEVAIGFLVLFMVVLVIYYLKLEDNKA